MNACDYVKKNNLKYTYKVVCASEREGETNGFSQIRVNGLGNVQFIFKLIGLVFVVVVFVASYV